MPPDLDFSTKPTLRGQRVTLRPLRAQVNRLDLGIEDTSGELVGEIVLEVFEFNPRVAAVDMVVSAASWNGFPAGSTLLAGSGGDRR